jgi:hypothetical protein
VQGRLVGARAAHGIHHVGAACQWRSMSASRPWVLAVGVHQHHHLAARAAARPAVSAASLPKLRDSCTRRSRLGCAQAAHHGHRVVAAAVVHHHQLHLGRQRPQRGQHLRQHPGREAASL